MYRLLFVVAILAKILMFRDAVRRGVPSHWFWIIAFVPFGEVIYFFVYPWDDPRLRHKRRGVLHAVTRPGVEKMRRQHKDEPDVDNKLRLATALYQRGMYEEAQQLLEGLTRHDEYHKEALYLLGQVRLQRNDPEGAGSLKHHVILSEYLIKCGRPEHAREQLRRARTVAGDGEWRERAERLLDNLAPCC